MKTKALITVLTLLLLTTPLALASYGEGIETETNNGKGMGEIKGIDSKDNQSTKSAERKVKQAVKLTLKPQGTTLSSCASSNSWRNHGEYVSCVAKLHLGGATTSAAARSDIGKRVEESTKSSTVSSKNTIKKAEKRLNWLRKWLGKHEIKESTNEATTEAKVKGDRVETIIYKLESLIERLTELLSFLKAK